MARDYLSRTSKKRRVQPTIAIGIPDPGFGINDVTPTAPSPWTSSITGSYYIDNTSGAATDANTYGWPAVPRLTIPATLAAGDKVFVHGGPYIYDTAFSTPNVTASGTSGNPVWIIGVADGGGNKPVIRSTGTYLDGLDTRNFNMGGDHWILDGLKFCDGSTMFVLMMGTYGTIRNSEIKNYQVKYFGGQQGPSAALGTLPSNPGNNLVIYNNTFSDIGHYQDVPDNKMQGIKFGGQAGTAGPHHVWILNNTFFHNGQAMQFGDDAIGTFPGGIFNADYAAFPNHFYIGGNTMHDDREVGIACKMVSDFIISQNTVYNYIDLPTGADCGTSPTITAINAGRFCPDYVWVIFNTIYNTSLAIRANDTNEAETGADPRESHFFAIGNLIHDVINTTSTTGANCSPYNAADANSAGVAIAGFLNRHVYCVDNTIVTAPKGISWNGVGAYTVTGNAVIGCGDPMNYVPTGFGSTNAYDYNFYEGTARLAYNSVTPIISLTTMQTHSEETHSLEGTSSLSTTTFKPGVGSPLIGANVRSTVYDIFLSRYGIDIATGHDGRARPSGAWSIGCLEP